jgi:hypothetical protein
MGTGDPQGLGGYEVEPLAHRIAQQRLRRDSPSREARLPQTVTEVAAVMTDLISRIGSAVPATRSGGCGLVVGINRSPPHLDEPDAAGCQDTRQLAECDPLVWDGLQHMRAHEEIDRVVGEWELGEACMQIAGPIVNSDIQPDVLIGYEHSERLRRLRRRGDVEQRPRAGDDGLEALDQDRKETMALEAKAVRTRGIGASAGTREERAGSDAVADRAIARWNARNTSARAFMLTAAPPDAATCPRASASPTVNCFDARDSSALPGAPSDGLRAGAVELR